MKIQNVQGDYQIDWYCPYHHFCNARDWCTDQFGDSWGQAQLGKLDRRFSSLNSFVFKKLHHAQWFMIRWANV